MADDDILSLATGREPELARIMNAVERSMRVAPGTLQHLVLYGNRGFGKSFTTRRVQIAVAERWPDIPFLMLPEEQHSMQRDPHSLLDTIALKLSDSRSGADSAYDEGHFRWPTAKDSAKRWDASESEVERALDLALPGGGIAVLVVENFDILLRKLFHEDLDEQRLRRWLDRKSNRLMLFATATGTVDMDYDRPLFHAFETVRLEPWSGDECIAYFNRLRSRDGLVPLGPEREAKARAVADFIGGTPRLAQLLGDVLETEDALEVAEIMTALTDRLADYYRRRIEDLPPLSIGLLDAIIRGGEPVSQTELAARVGAGGQSDIARVMSELQRADIVRGRPAPNTREKLYRVPDRVFVHYYRLRQGSRAAQDTPLTTILDFLRSFYSRAERRLQSLTHLEAGRIREARLFSDLAREGEPRSTDKFMENFVKDFKFYLGFASWRVGISAEEVAALLEGSNPEEAYLLCQNETQRGAAGAISAMVRAHAVHRFDHPGKAKEILESALTCAEEEDEIARFILIDQMCTLAASRSHLDAAQMANALEDLGANLPIPMEAKRLRRLAWRSSILGHHTKALEAATLAVARAIEAGDSLGEIEGLRLKMFALRSLGRLMEALEVACRSADLAAREGDARGEAASLRFQAGLLDDLGQYDRALVATSRAVERAAKAGDAFEEVKSLHIRAITLGNLKRHEEALEAAYRAAERAAEVSNANGEVIGLRLQSFALSNLGRHEEALETSARAAERAIEAGETREELVSLRLRALTLGDLGRYEEALAAASRAAERAAELGEALEEALSLRLKSLTLDDLERHEEALEAASQGVERALEAGDTEVEVANLRYRAISLGRLERYEEALEAATQAVNRASLTGQIREESNSVRFKAQTLGKLGRHREAWIDAKRSADLARSANDAYSLSWSILQCVITATHIERPDVVSLFDEWLRLQQANKSPNLAKAELEVGTLFAAVARAGEWEALDQLIEEQAAALTSFETTVWFHRSVGEDIAKISFEKGRAEGYEAMASALPRIAALVKRLPDIARDPTWLPDIITGFAEACRDPGLLRDVATLMAPDIAPQAAESARLLYSLAKVDEAEDPETPLARMDPDVATVIRRLRGLTDPEPVSSGRKRIRKKRGR
ncbi:ATP-binding protein [Alloyangia pacifica]|nr:ATP-binding protein [Alloyangia pacifica]